MRCSVVIPTYNRVESLRRTLDALSRQTLDSAEFEVVVVSDGSTDGTSAMLDEYAASGKLLLRPHHQENAGPAAARNLGIREARGEVVVFIDDDVEPVAGCLERHLSHHADNLRLVVLGLLSPNPAYAAEEPAWIAWEHDKLQSVYALFSPGGEYHGAQAGPEHFYSGNASVRRQWLIQVGGFDTRFKRQEDVEMAGRLSKQCGLRFEWDFAADGLHHPVRTLDSWLKIPSAYGELDAERVRGGAMPEGSVLRNNASRHPLTRALTAAGIAAPALVKPITASLCGLSALLNKLGRRGAALSALSAAYNLLYVDAYRKAISRTSPEAAEGGVTRLAA